MALLSEMLVAVNREGYEDANANAKVCQDVILDAIAHSDMNRQITIKGGVVMRSITGNVRRAQNITAFEQDGIQIYFIFYFFLCHSSITSLLSVLNPAVRRSAPRTPRPGAGNHIAFP